MNSMFARALLGFSLLMAALIVMISLTLSFIEGLQGLALVVIAVGVVAKFGVYFTTLHEPIYKWIESIENSSRKFGRSIIGFLLLTGVLLLEAMLIIYWLGTYASDYSWAEIVLVLVALIAEGLVYATTLHPPVSAGIKGSKAAETAGSSSRYD